MARILIVDDSNFSRRTLRAMLESGGHEVHEAGDGLAALEQYFLVKPDLVLLDLTMKEMGGLEVLTRLRELDPAGRVVVATADIQSSTRKLVDEAGACGFVGKPFAAAEILKTVQAVLTQPLP
jgi:two-component system chemotaxis response regulator CheY